MGVFEVSPLQPPGLSLSLTDIKSLRFIRAGSGRDAVGHALFFFFLAKKIPGASHRTGIQLEYDLAVSSATH